MIMGWGGYLGLSSVPNVITGVLLGGRQEGQSRRSCANRVIPCEKGSTHGCFGEGRGGPQNQ